MLSLKYSSSNIFGRRCNILSPDFGHCFLSLQQSFSPDVEMFVDGRGHDHREDGSDGLALTVKVVLGNRLQFSSLAVILYSIMG